MFAQVPHPSGEIVWGEVVEILDGSLRIADPVRRSFYTVAESDVRAMRDDKPRGLAMKRQMDLIEAEWNAMTQAQRHVILTE